MTFVVAVDAACTKENFGAPAQHMPHRGHNRDIFSIMRTAEAGKRRATFLPSDSMTESGTSAAIACAVTKGTRKVRNNPEITYLLLTRGIEHKRVKARSTRCNACTGFGATDRVGPN